MPYVFDIPRGRGYLDEDEARKCDNKLPPKPGLDELNANGLVLHILHARVAANDGHWHEFDQIFDPDNKTIELDVPDCYLDFLEEITVGPRICRYLTWLFCNGLGAALSDNLKWESELNGLTEPSADRFETSEPFFPQTLAVFVNGIKVNPEADDGFIILDDQTFEMKETLRPKDCVSVGYMSKT
jgi:hypothetical protein